ncbi:zinc finger (C3HC4 RING finger) protein, putative [Eimeria maxima]|uniref:Zinc finger (C3HC4 RING finger) protein, putative n=1 Tax=Eimeria maxima TaxID=5804 RepID=U6M577_EIMMA|nr:zinc finger (C3HC4 RING finger) protein, putative [Eimeria maxima]CDJ57579.1 zinc finger (C3HC4 RING finger) protein, putative [Eimeria maxima]
MPGPGPQQQQQQQLPRLSVQKTFVVRNPVNIVKSSLAARVEGGRVIISFLLDTLAPAEVSLFFFPHNLQATQQGDPPCLFASRPRIFGVGLQQFFEASVDDSPLASACVDALKAKGGANRQQAEDCDLLIQLRVVSPEGKAGTSAAGPTAAAAGQPGVNGGPADAAAAAAEGVRQQLTYVAFVLQETAAAAAAAAEMAAAREPDHMEETTNRTLTLSHSSSSITAAAAEAATAAAAHDPAASVWRLCVLKQKVELGTRSFEVQEIFGIDGGAGFSRQRQKTAEFTNGGTTDAAAAAAAPAAATGPLRLSSNDENLSGRKNNSSLAL